MDQVGLVIFDNDGVLVDSEKHAHPVLARLLTELGYTISIEESVRRFLGTSIAHVRSGVEEELERRLPNDFEDRYHEALFSSFQRGLESVPGVHGAIAMLQVPYCVASSGSVERIRRSLSITGLWPLFEGRAYSADQVAHGKPAPDLFLLAAKAMGVEPEACVVIEDSRFGIEAANRAGMASIGFARTTPAEVLAEATLGIVQRMDELPAVLPTVFQPQ